MANNTLNFTVTAIKKFELHILAPLFTWKNCKNYEILLYSMSCTSGCWKLQIEEHFLQKLGRIFKVRNMQIQAATLQLIASAISRKRLSHFEWLDLQPMNFKECACLTAVLCHDMVLHDSLKLSSFIEITIHPQICCFWCCWVDLTNLYNCSFFNLSRTILQMPSNLD